MPEAQPNITTHVDLLLKNTGLVPLQYDTKADGLKFTPAASVVGIGATLMVQITYCSATEGTRLFTCTMNVVGLRDPLKFTVRTVVGIPRLQISQTAHFDMDLSSEQAMKQMIYPATNQIRDIYTSVCATNNGLTSLTLTVPPNGPFTLNPSTVTIEPQKNQQFKIFHTLSSLPPQFPKLLLLTNSKQSPQHLLATKFNINMPTIEVAPLVIDFGSIPLNKPSSSEFTISNSGTVDAIYKFAFPPKLPASVAKVELIKHYQFGNALIEPETSVTLFPNTKTQFTVSITTSSTTGPFCCGMFIRSVTSILPTNFISDITVTGCNVPEIKRNRALGPKVVRIALLGNIFNEESFGKYSAVSHNIKEELIEKCHDLPFSILQNQSSGQTIPELAISAIAAQYHNLIF